jgi:hypothetical protein
LCRTALGFHHSYPLNTSSTTITCPSHGTWRSHVGCDALETEMPRWKFPTYGLCFGRRSLRRSAMHISLLIRIISALAHCGSPVPSRNSFTGRFPNLAHMACATLTFHVSSWPPEPTHVSMAGALSSGISGGRSPPHGDGGECTSPAPPSCHFAAFCSPEQQLPSETRLTFFPAGNAIPAACTDVPIDARRTRRNASLSGRTSRILSWLRPSPATSTIFGPRAAVEI